MSKKTTAKKTIQPTPIKIKTQVRAGFSI